MRIIDAFTGKAVVPGPWYQGPGFQWRILQVKDRFLSAQALFEVAGRKPVWTPLAVRFTHPRFPLQRVAFVPT